MKAAWNFQWSIRILCKYPALLLWKESSSPVYSPLLPKE